MPCRDSDEEEEKTDDRHLSTSSAIRVQSFGATVANIRQVNQVYNRQHQGSHTVNSDCAGYVRSFQLTFPAVAESQFFVVNSTALTEAKRPNSTEVATFIMVEQLCPN